MLHWPDLTFPPINLYNAPHVGASSLPKEIPMRALLICAQGIIAVELDPRDTPTSMLNHMQCQTVTGAGYPDAGHACWADDEALLTLEAKLEENGSVFACQASWYPETLVGNLLVTGFDPDTGETTAATMELKELASMIKPGAIKPHPKQ